MITQTDIVKHHERAFAFRASGLGEAGLHPEAGLDFLHTWLAAKRPDEVAALHSALMETEDQDREGFETPEIYQITIAEEAALYFSIPDHHQPAPHQTITIRALREH